MYKRGATTYTKTTVMFPTEVMKEIRQLLVDQDVSSHGQSRVVANLCKFVLKKADAKTLEDIIHGNFEHLRITAFSGYEGVVTGGVDAAKMADSSQQHTDEAKEDRKNEPQMLPRL